VGLDCVPDQFGVNSHVPVHLKILHVSVGLQVRRAFRPKSAFVKLHMDYVKAQKKEGNYVQSMGSSNRNATKGGIPGKVGSITPSLSMQDVVRGVQ
jgi:hypothetical protein